MFPSAPLRPPFLLSRMFPLSLLSFVPLSFHSSPLLLLFFYFHPHFSFHPSFSLFLSSPPPSGFWWGVWVSFYYLIFRFSKFLVSFRLCVCVRHPLPPLFLSPPFPGFVSPFSAFLLWVVTSSVSRFFGPDPLWSGLLFAPLHVLLY